MPVYGLAKETNLSLFTTEYIEDTADWMPDKNSGMTKKMRTSFRQCVEPESIFSVVVQTGCRIKNPGMTKK